MRRFMWMIAGLSALCGLFGGDFDIQAHRGGRGLFPENTMAAFVYTIENQLANTLELDVVVTKDHVLVVSHDRFLNPQKIQKDGRFLIFPIPIYSLTREDLKGYTAGVMRSDYLIAGQKQVPGEPIPTLEEVLALVKRARLETGRKIMLNIEMKIVPDKPSESPDPETFARLVTDLVSDSEMADQVIIQSFYWEMLLLVRKNNPALQTAALYSTANTLKPGYYTPEGRPLPDEELFRRLSGLGVSVFSPRLEDFSPDWVENAHRLGIRIIPWTVNRVEDMETLIRYGVDGIITDYPDRLKEVLKTLENAQSGG